MRRIAYFLVYVIGFLAGLFALAIAIIAIAPAINSLLWLGILVLAVLAFFAWVMPRTGRPIWKAFGLLVPLANVWLFLSTFWRLAGQHTPPPDSHRPTWRLATSTIPSVLGAMLQYKLPLGFTARPLTDGTSVELVPPPWGGKEWLGIIFLVVFSSFWNLGVITCLRIWDLPMAKGACDSPGWHIMVPIGLFVTALTLDLAFVRRHWVVRPGQITDRISIPVLKVSWECVYSRLLRFEIRYNIWENRMGTTDSLWFRTADSIRSVRVVFGERGVIYGVIVNADHIRRVRDVEEKVIRDESEWDALVLDPDVVAVGRFLADRTGTPLVVVVDVIKPPRT